MTKFNTGNPVGSSDPRDLYDNAENLDNLVNGDQAAYNDRLGKSRRSWQSVEDQVNQQEVEFNADQTYRANAFQAAQDDREGVFNAYLVSAGYQFAGDYAAGIEITQYNQVVRDSSGELWRASGSTELPYTTTGAGLPEGGAFVAVGDAVLRQELGGTLSSGMGANLVNGATIYVGSVADLITAPSPQEGSVYSVTSYWPGWNALAAKPRGGGLFVWDSTADKSRHDGATVINPDAVLPSDFEEANRAAAYDWFYQPTATGTGCFIRVIAEDEPYNLNAFGCKGDGLADDSIPVQFCLYRAIYDGKATFAPAGVYLKGSALSESFPVSSGGSRWLDFLLPEGCTINIQGEGKGVTEFKVADTLISTRGRFTFTFGFTPTNSVNLPAFVSASDFTINQNGTGNPLGGAPTFEFEQAHCFALYGHGRSEFRNIHIKDKVGGGIVFAGGVADSFLTDNITESDFSGNFGERADIESQGFAELASISNSLGRYIQVESNQGAPSGRKQQVEIVNSKFDIIDLDGGNSINSFFAKLSNTTARTDCYFSNGVFQATNCVLRHGDAFEWANWREGSVFSDTTILLAVSGSGIVASIRPRLGSGIGGICEWTFDNCSILIDSDDPLFVPSNANYLIAPTGIYSSSLSADCRIFVSDCSFDRRTKGIANNYRTIPITVSRSRIAGTGTAFAAGQDSGRKSGLSLIDNDYSLYNGTTLIRMTLQSSATPGFSFVMRERMRTDQFTLSYGSGTNQSTIESAGLYDMMTDLYGPSNPSAGLKGIKVYNTAPASAAWYLRVSTGGSTFVDAITLP